MHNLKDYATNMATWVTPTIPSGICVFLVKVYADTLNLCDHRRVVNLMENREINGIGQEEIV